MVSVGKLTAFLKVNANLQSPEDGAMTVDRRITSFELVVKSIMSRDVKYLENMWCC
jgi:hypothetical protein